MIEIRLDVDSVAALADAWRRAPDVVQDELRRYITTVTAHLQGEVQERTPTYLGTLRKSIIGDVRALPGIGVEGVIGSPLAYAVPVELGSKPHMPPVQPLVEWAKAKLGVRGKEAERVGFAVARKISRTGTAGAFMFRDTFEANEARVVRGFDVVVRRIADRLAGGAA